MKKWVKYFAIFFVFFTIALLYNMNYQDIQYDRIWVFHNCQKVAEGYSLYSEINTIQGPIFFCLVGWAMKLFDVNFITFDAFGAVCYALIAVFFFAITHKINRSKNPFIEVMALFIVFLYLKISWFTNYNFLVVLFILMTVYFELKRVDSTFKNRYDYLIGFLIRNNIFNETKHRDICFIFLFTFCNT